MRLLASILFGTIFVVWLMSLAGSLMQAWSEVQYQRNAPECLRKYPADVTKPLSCSLSSKELRSVIRLRKSQGRSADYRYGTTCPIVSDDVDVRCASIEELTSDPLVWKDVRDLPSRFHE